MSDVSPTDSAKDLLDTLRQTLEIYLKQFAMHGAANVPPSIVHGIREARAAIQQIKINLRRQGEVVDDQQNDFYEIVYTKGTHADQYYKEQFNAYLTIWKELQKVVFHADKVWANVTRENVSELNAIVEATKISMDEKSIFFEESDLNDLRYVIDDLYNFTHGKLHLSRLLFDRDLGKPELMLEVEEQINQNRHFKDAYEVTIERIRINFKQRLSGM